MTSRKKKDDHKVKIYENKIVEFDDGKLIIEIDEDGKVHKVYCVYNGEEQLATPCKKKGGVKNLSIGSVVVREIGSFCICYRDSSGRIRCYGYPPGTNC